MYVESHAPYIKVFLVLLVFTLIEYFYAMFFSGAFYTLVLGLMFCAVIKAGLVGWYFMHLKFERRWVYFMLVPAGILACVLIFALIPDIANPAIDDETGINDDDTAAISAPLDPTVART